MHCFDRFASLLVPTDVGLVGDDDQQEGCCLQPRAACSHAVVKLKIFDTRRRIWVTVADNSPVENAIAIKEDRALR
jgi:hypothetical protein